VEPGKKVKKDMPCRSQASLALDARQANTLPPASRQGERLLKLGSSGKTYRVWRAVDFNPQTFRLIATNLAAFPPMNTLVDSIGNESFRFYFIEVE